VNVAAGKVVVVTGSTRGIGNGLARAFVERGCSVVVSGRSQDAVDDAVGTLDAGDRVLGVAADVTSFDDQQRLWDDAVARFGRVDVWIANAGVSAPRQPLQDLPPETIATVVDTNVLGTLHSCQVALRGMVAAGAGQLWLMEGFGSGGEKAPGMATYGSTKKAVRYLTRALQKETAGTGVQVGALSPGIVVTDLLLGDYEGQPEQREKAMRVFRILGDRVETVTPWLADRVLATDKSGRRIAWLTKPKAFGRFATASFSKRDPFAA
jgi:NAD(P)-dependent dehydrogenase (short-subunit alcohol dehydrogenase family)